MKINKKSGFSLIEVVVAISVFIFLVTYITASLPNSLKAVEMGKDRMIAGHIARKEMEFVRSLSWSEQDSSNPALQGRYTTIITRLKDTEIEKNFYSYFDISTHPEDSNLKIIKVSIRWDQGKIQSPPGYREVTLETFTYKNG